MEEYLKNIDAWCWRYTDPHAVRRSYPGLHLTAKPKACAAILRCLQSLRVTGAGTYRTIPLQTLKPADEAKVTGGLEYVSFSRLRITLQEESEELRQFRIQYENDIALFEFTSKHLERLAQGIKDISQGTGDYSMAPIESRREGLALGESDKLSLCLWFWPCFGHLAPVQEQCH